MSEIRQLLVKVIRQEAENPRHSVAQITTKIMADRPGDVDEWVAEHRGLMFSRWVGDILRFDRIAERKRAPLEEIIERTATGMSLFNLSYVVNDDNVRKSLGELTGNDHRYVADSYRKQSEVMSNYSDLHHKIADTVGRKLTRTVYTETELRNLFAQYEGRI